MSTFAESIEFQFPQIVVAVVWNFYF